MLQTKVQPAEDLNPEETAEWLQALDQIVDEAGPDRASFLLNRLVNRARTFGAAPAYHTNTPYVNTIAAEGQVPFPGDRALERRLKSLIRWNALAMVVRANKYDAGIGGHISTYASLATLVEVGFNHFFRGSLGEQPGDLMYFQGHAAPGFYARAFLEGRLNEEHLRNFRHELREHPGLSSYPHPWLMPNFWQFPTVSMGLGPINSIYQARFMKYLENRGLIPPTNRKVWAFLGDGEMEEPESTGALRIAANEKLDNLIFVINCNLQRLDGPVRGNGKIIQELESLFAGARWNVIKVVWGDDWDDLLARDTSGLLVRRMNECLDGDYQTMAARGGAYIRQEFFGKYPELLELVKDLSDEQLAKLRRGGHDPAKVYNAYQRAMEHQGSPTVILAKTIKGYGLGEAGEGRNITHQQKKLNEEEMAYFCRRFEIPMTGEQLHEISFYRPPEDSPEMKYLRERRQALGGDLPTRNARPVNMQVPPLEYFAETLTGSQGREVSTTMAYVRVMTLMLRHPEIGKYVVPIIPDEARTFGMESLFRQIGIYASQGQLYHPVDQEMFLYYKESKSGQILEEGITEAGGMASFTAAGTAYANYGVPMIPLYTYYSMFGLQRMGDQIWAFADSRGKGFIVGATAGRTTLAGEGLQHQDGHSHLLMSVVPTCVQYDPAYAYEIGVIMQDGLRRMYQENEDVFYYLTVYNENYPQPPMPDGVREGILKGAYKFKPAGEGKAVVQLFGSGPMLNEALAAQAILAEKYKIAADVWSVTSYTELRREALAAERWNRLHPAEPARRPYVSEMLDGSDGPVIASSDYMKAVADQIAPWLPGRLVSLGTDGFGRSENREHLRTFFEVGTKHIVAAALSRLAREGKFDAAAAAQTFTELGVDPERADPARS
ncbi:MAG TPA: pyruvate dehydrogenase (acetyl-transferring), homodimeric type [Bryobacteraceae bacterium]|nr:pyruvate dehydrogenase (acetyl-transferring), homodimeric type [Bryobacteraceae bacterium]